MEGRAFTKTGATVYHENVILACSFIFSKELGGAKPTLGHNRGAKVCLNCTGLIFTAYVEL